MGHLEVVKIHVRSRQLFTVLTVIHFEQESHGLHPNNRDLQPSLTEAFKVLFKECGVHMLRPNIQIKNNYILPTLKIISSHLCLTKISLN